MAEAFTIESDPARGVLRLVLRGFWTGDTLAAFAAAVDQAARALPCGIGHHRVLVLLHWPVQSQALFAAMLDYLRAAEPKPQRLALVAAPALVRLQARRSLDPAHMAMFEDEDEARGWLLAPARA